MFLVLVTPLVTTGAGSYFHVVVPEFDDPLEVERWYIQDGAIPDDDPGEYPGPNQRSGCEALYDF